MLLPKGTIVAVADGEKFSLFSNTGDEAGPTLTPMAEPDIENVNTGSGASNQNESQAAEDGFAGGIAGLLNKRVPDGEISDLIIIAAPRTLGELRKSYHKKLSFFAARSPRTLPVMRCMILRKRSLPLNGESTLWNSEWRRAGSEIFGLTVGDQKCTLENSQLLSRRCYSAFRSGACLLR